ncbi:MAG: hypothetical protein MJ175_01600 [Clostridia bacterium]|nr:hypothetical protein [Clostridia bacterium]
MKKFPVTGILAGLLAVSLLSACGETAADPTPGKDTVPTPDNAIETEAETTDPNAPAVTDLGGYRFYTNVRSSTTGNGNFLCEDFFASEENGEPINDAVYRRNRSIEERYNCSIEQWDSQGDQYQELSRVVQAGDAVECGIVLGTNAASLAQEGMLLDLYSMNLDFSKPYWDQSCVDAFTIGGHMYFVTGDMNISTWDLTRVSVFSKKLIKDLDLPDPYQLVRDGKWTLDRMLEMALKANIDLDNNGKITKDDQVGLYIYGWAPEYYFYGAGERISTMDAEGYPQLSVYNSRSVDVFDKIFNSVTSGRTDVTGGFSGDQKECFTADRCLFTQFAVWDIRKDLRVNCENDFGILPIPKYDDAQEQYYNLVTFNNCTHLWCVPTTCSDPVKAAAVIDAMAYESTSTLRAAYYDTTLQGKVLRDNDSAEMLDLIFSNRIYDLAIIYNWGKWDDYLIGVRDTKSNKFTSTYESRLSKTEDAINATIEAYQNVRD